MDTIQNINQSSVDNIYGRQVEPSNEMNHDAFLKLFIESLKNQNPLEPMEQSEMMAQITNLAMMESVQGMKQMIESLASNFNKEMNLVSNIELIGKRVKVENSEGEFEGVVVGVGRQMDEEVFEMDDGKFYLIDTIVGVEENI